MVKKDCGDKRSIAVVLWYKQDQDVNEVYYNQIIEGIRKIGEINDIDIKIIYNDNYLFKRAPFECVDGIIGIGKFGTKTIKLFESCVENIVFVDFSPNISKYDSVVIDFKNAVENVVKELIYKGYNSIGYLGGVEYVDDQTKLGERRGRVFKKNLEARDMFFPQHMHLGRFSTKSGYNLMKAAIDRGDLAEVYFCGDDTIAQGALKALRDAGIKVPEEVGIIGFNDSPSHEKVIPPLTSVHVHANLIGEQAFYSILEQLNETRKTPIRKVIPTFVRHRKSLR